MASPRCGTGADPFASLPLDLVAHLLSYLRLRPRLRVLALVSRRWRDAVTRTITSLTPAAPAELLAHPRYPPSQGARSPLPPRRPRFPGATGP